MSLIATKDLEAYLKTEGFLSTPITNREALPLYEAVWAMCRALHAADVLTDDPLRWSRARRILAVTQHLWRELGFYTGKIDGLRGPMTDHALEQWQDFLREDYLPGVPVPAPGRPDKPAGGVPETRLAELRTLRQPWPRYTNPEMTRFFGAPGTSIVRAALPYPMRIAWDLDQVVTSHNMNRRIVESFTAVLEAVRDHYGTDEIRRLRLDRFGGIYNLRKVRGGTIWSTHAYGAALDIDPAHNAYRWGADRAALDHPDYDAFWAIFEATGWVSLGRERNYDWMHVQAATL